MRNGYRSILTMAGVGFVFSVFPAHSSADENGGAWSARVRWPEVAVHMLHLKTGKVFIWPGYYDETPIPTWIWDLPGDCFDDYDPGNDCFVGGSYAPTNLFCAGHALLADSRIVIAGGHVANHVGLRDANIFDPETEVITPIAPVDNPRWYPTCTSLPDGRVLTVSGDQLRCVGGGDEGQECRDDDDCSGVCRAIIEETPEVYNAATNSWTSLTSARLSVPFYPFMFVLPDGDVFFAGADTYEGNSSALNSYVLHINDDIPIWSFVDRSGNVGGSAVMYEPGKILKTGGVHPVANAFAEVIDMGPGGDRNWRFVQQMAYARHYHTLTVLPDGTVLATGGTRYGNVEDYNVCVGGDCDGDECDTICFGGSNNGRGCAFSADCPGGACAPYCSEGGTCMSSRCAGGDNNGDVCSDNGDCPGGSCRRGRAWVAPAELFDPVTETWSTMASAEVPRMYHSTAMLLPDGRVLSVGGGQGGGAINNYPYAQYFSPPYLFQGSRPSVTSAPDTLHYRDVFEVETPQADSIDKVSLVAVSLVTHAFDQNQRFVPLDFVARSGRLIVYAPEDAPIAPQGAYMLFLVSDAGVPSIGRIVQMRKPDAVWVDFAYNGTETGVFEQPFDTLAEGVAAVARGGPLRIKAGSTRATATISKPMSISSFGGTVTIGR